jgi:DNA end-binding protein Ku
VGQHDDDEFEALLERSSLGTSGARRLRSRASASDMARVRKMLVQTATQPSSDTSSYLTELETATRRGESDSRPATTSQPSQERSALRPIWSGSISFGLVTVPVELFAATENHGVRFQPYQRGTTDRVRYQRVNERTGAEVAYHDIVHGLSDEAGQAVIVERAELDEIALGQSHSHAIDVSGFVDLDEIDPIYFQKTYWLAPAETRNAKVYALLAAAMQATNRAAIANLVMRGKQHLCAVRAHDGVLSLETLYYADEIHQPREQLANLPEPFEPEGPEFDMASTLIESMSVAWRPEDYRDTYTDKVKQLIEDKRAGNIEAAETAPPKPTDLADLLEVLSRSVEARHAS